MIGLGEKKEDLDLLLDFISEHKLDRITFYALKPVRGTEFENAKSPDIEYYCWWISRIREKFPDLDIVAGLTPKKIDYVEHVLKAGANTLTKFPALRLFGSDLAKSVEEQARKAGFEFVGSLTELPDIDWDNEVDKLDLDEELKKQVKVKLKQCLSKMNI